MDCATQPQVELAFALQPRGASDCVPLTRIQQRALNFLLEYSKGKPISVRMCATRLRFRGQLDAGALRESIARVIARHESLRARILLSERSSSLSIDSSSAPVLEEIDLTHVPAARITSEAKQRALRFADTLIDLSLGPLFEGRLLKLASDDHVLILALDHMTSDVISNAILTREIVALYRELTTGESAVLPRLAVQFGDYALWQARTAAAWEREHAPYWRGRLADAIPVRHPPDHAPSTETRPSIEKLHFPFGRKVSTGLNDLARRNQTLLPLAVLCIHALITSRWINQEDIVLRFLSHGRYRRPELQNMIGWLADFLFFRISIRGSDRFLDLLQQVHSEFYAAQAHQDFGRVPDLFPECSTELVFNWLRNDAERTPAGRREENGSPLQILPYGIDFPVPAKFAPLTPFGTSFADTPSGIVATVMFRPDLFERDTVMAYGNGLRALAEQAVASPAIHLSELIVSMPSASR
jgi:hypothetical protein